LGDFFFGKRGEIAECVHAPRVEDRHERGGWIGGDEGKRIEEVAVVFDREKRVSEFGSVAGKERCGGETGGGGKIVRGEFGEGVTEKRFRGGVSVAAKVESEEAGGGGFDGGCERKGDGELGGVGFGFSSGIGDAECELRTTCEGLRAGDAGFYGCGAGAGVAEEDGGFAAGVGEEGDGFSREIGASAEERLQGEVGDAEDGEHGG